MGELWARNSGGKRVFRFVYLDDNGMDMQAQLDGWSVQIAERIYRPSSRSRIASAYFGSPLAARVLKRNSTSNAVMACVLSSSMSLFTLRSIQ